jgi:hypothetical protein
VIGYTPLHGCGSCAVAGCAAEERGSFRRCDLITCCMASLCQFEAPRASNL